MAQKPEKPAFIYAESATGKRGVYLRDCSMDTPYEEAFVPKVRWPDGALSADKAAFMLQLKLESDVPWATCSEHVTLFNEAAPAIIIKVGALVVWGLGALGDHCL